MTSAIYWQLYIIVSTLKAAVKWTRCNAVMNEIIWRAMLCVSDRTAQSISHSKSGHIVLQWRHNEGNGVSNRDCLLNRLFKAWIKENIKGPRHWPLWGEFTGDRWIPGKKACNAEKVFIWWRHHGENEGDI